MVTRELVYSEIDRLNASELDEIYKLIRQMSRSKRKSKKKGALSKIRRIRIVAPRDFSVNHDFYIARKHNA